MYPLFFENFLVQANSSQGIVLRSKSHLHPVTTKPNGSILPKTQDMSIMSLMSDTRRRHESTLCAISLCTSIQPINPTG